MDQTQIALLVSDAKAGNKDAQSLLYLEFHDCVYRACFRCLGRHHESLDLVQDVFIVAFTRLPTLKQNNSFPAWIYQIARHLSINYLVRRPPQSLEFTPSEENLDPADIAANHEIAVKIRETCNRLREIDRQMLWEFYWNGSSLLEIADIYHIPLGTVKSRLFTARIRFAKSLQSQCPEAIPQ